MTNPIVIPAYSGNIQYYSILSNFREVYLEQYAHYVKQTYRNRCQILTANGVMNLTIPVEKVSGEKMLDKDVKISADKPVVFSVFVSKLEVPTGVVVDGGKDSEGRSRKKIQIDVNDEKNMILLSGDVYVKTSDFKKVPTSVEMNMALFVKTLDMKSNI